MVPQCVNLSSLTVINARDSECALLEGFSPWSIGLEATVIKQDMMEQHVVELALTLWPGFKNSKFKG